MNNMCCCKGLHWDCWCGGEYTTIVQAVAEGVITAQDQSLLVQHGGHIDLTSSVCSNRSVDYAQDRRNCKQ